MPQRPKWASSALQSRMSQPSTTLPDSSRRSLKKHMSDTSETPADASLSTSPSPAIPASTGRTSTRRKKSLYRHSLFAEATLARSRKDSSGQIKVTRHGLVYDGTAREVLRRLEQSAGSKEDIIEKLEAVEEHLQPSQMQLLVYLRNPEMKQFSLGRLVAESGCSPVAILKKYMEGAILLGRVEAAIAAAKEQPRIIRELTRDAFAEKELCKICVGTGLVYGPRALPDSPPRTPCSFCKGKGHFFEESDHKEFALTKLMDFNQMVPKVPLVDLKVQQNTLSLGSGIMERLLKSSEEAVYGAPVIDVQPESGSTEPGEAREGAESVPEGAHSDPGKGFPSSD